MGYKPATEEARRFYEKIRKDPTVPTCDKCACNHCVNWNECKDCSHCESGTYTLPCKKFKEKA